MRPLVICNFICFQIHIMRRTPYFDRNEKNYIKLQHKQKPQLDVENSNFRLQMKQVNQESFLSNRTNRYSYLYRPTKTSSKRPYTTQRSNSMVESKKQDHQKDRNNSKSKTPSKDLWVSTVKDQNKYIELGYHNKGKIHRGISLKDDRSFISKQQVDYRYVRHSQTPKIQSARQESAPKSKRSGVIDLIGKNLKKSMSSKNNKQDEFFQYVMRFSYKTKKGYVPSNPNKVNQDSYITSPNINGKTWEHLFGICDGHGPLGHLVSGFIKTALPQCIGNMKNLQKNPKTLLAKAYQNAYERLIKQSHVDMSFSGSTVITVYFIQNKLYCCNVGDSRAILGRCNSIKNGQTPSWKAIPLSTDHKPSLPDQAQRIRKMKGRVQAFRDEYGQQIGPLRVWIKNENVPGLAMTRSFGDLVGKSVGVSHIPQIKEFTLSQQDKIVLIASDGVFQFLQNEQLLKELVPYYQKKQIQQASDHLLSLANRSWTKNSSIIDDITFILIFINYNQF